MIKPSLELLLFENIDNKDPVLSFINQLIQTATVQRISDIHIEPQEKHYRIRFRCHGLLQVVDSISHAFALQVIASLKIMAQLDIAEKRLPQDGRLHLASHHHFNIRISTCPSLFGEKVALRLLDNQHDQFQLDTLGLTAEQLDLLIDKLSAPQGLIILTGPTGSGKTSTLYAALNHLNQQDKNIMTIEDPIEMKLAGVTQINVNPRIKLTFSYLLRSLMRQDPDVIMIGEIRDKETAEIAVQASHTGHLVLSTLHCDTAADALARLTLLGVDEHYLLPALSLIIAQRLVRVKDNKQRIGIFALSTVVNKTLHTPLSLWQAGMLKVKDNITDLAELKRVIRPC